METAESRRAFIKWSSAALGMTGLTSIIGCGEVPPPPPGAPGKTRYKAAFSPPKRLEVDANTSALFHFDGDLKGLCGTDGKRTNAEPGTAG